MFKALVQAHWYRDPSTGTRRYISAYDRRDQKKPVIASSGPITLAIVKSGPLYDYNSGQIYAHGERVNILDNGEKIGEILVNSEEDIIWNAQNIDVADIESTTGPNSLGPVKMFHLVRAAKKLWPNVKHLTGFRTTGARAKHGQHMQINPVPVTKAILTTIDDLYKARLG